MLRPTSPYQVEIDRLKRQRRWLIATGIPLVICLALSLYYIGGVWAVTLGYFGGAIATKLWDLIVTHEPAIDDPH